MDQLGRFGIGSPVELGADLPNTGIARIADNSETPGVVDVASRVRELRVVEDVEEFDAQIKRQLLLNDGSLQDAEVGVVESRAVEEAAVRGAKRAWGGVKSKSIGQEIASRARAWDCRVERRTSGIRIARIHNPDRADAIRHICASTAIQRGIVVALVQLDGKARREPRDPLHLPALRQALGRFFESAVERDGPNIAGHEVVCYVGRRQPTAQPGIREVRKVAEP